MKNTIMMGSYKLETKSLVSCGLVLGLLCGSVLRWRMAGVTVACGRDGTVKAAVMLERSTGTSGFVGH